MKKLFMGMLLVILLILVACGDAKQTPTNTDTNTKENDEQTTDTNGCRFPNNFSYEEYLNYIQSTELPNNFVKYETISEFGEFDSFIFSDIEVNDHYLYILVDKDTGLDNLPIYIYHNRDLTLSDNEEPITEVNENDMRTISEDGVKVFTQSDIQYCYVDDGKLLSISWMFEDVKYTISSGDLSKCKLDSSSPLSKLLKLDTAAETIASIMKSAEEAA